MRTNTRMLILAALFSALTAIGAFLKFPLGAMSVTLQFLFTAMAGVLLGARWGALSQAEKDGAAVTDDCSAVERLGMKVRLVEGEEENFKVTTRQDLLLARAIVQGDLT